MHGTIKQPCFADVVACSLSSGHQSFSNNRQLNDLVGNITHSSILVPYHGWRISHRTHHANHGHVENDESWHPMTKKIYTNMVRRPARCQNLNFNISPGAWHGKCMVCRFTIRQRESMHVLQAFPGFAQAMLRLPELHTRRLMLTCYTSAAKSSGLTPKAHRVWTQILDFWLLRALHADCMTPNSNKAAQIFSCNNVLMISQPISNACDAADACGEDWQANFPHCTAGIPLLPEEQNARQGGIPFRPPV